MESMTFGTGMDERDVAPEEAVRVPQPRTWSDDPDTAYRRLFDAAAQSPESEEAVAPRPRRSRRRTRRILATVVVLLLLLGGGAAGAFAWTTHARKQPALDALRAGNDAFEPVASALRRATDLTGLRTAAEG